MAEEKDCKAEEKKSQVEEKNDDVAARDVSVLEDLAKAVPTAVSKSSEALPVAAVVPAVVLLTAMAFSRVTL